MLLFLPLTVCILLLILPPPCFFFFFFLVVVAAVVAAAVRVVRVFGDVVVVAAAVVVVVVVVVGAAWCLPKCLREFQRVRWDFGKGTPSTPRGPSRCLKNPLGKRSGVTVLDHPNAPFEVFKGSVEGFQGAPERGRDPLHSSWGLLSSGAAFCDVGKSGNHTKATTRTTITTAATTTTTAKTATTTTRRRFLYCTVQ